MNSGQKSTLIWLCSFITACGQSFIPSITNRFVPTVYFAATSVDRSGFESDYSNEILLRVTNLYSQMVELVWDKKPNSDSLTYRVYRGSKPHTYTTNFSAGTNLCITMPLYPPPLTNYVITVNSMNATDILWATSLAFIGPWQRIGRTNWSATNPAPRVCRAIGRKGSKPSTFMAIRWQ